MSEQTLAINNFERDNTLLGKIKQLCKKHTSEEINDELFAQIISALKQINPDDKIVKSCNDVLSKIYDTFSKKIHHKRISCEMVPHKTTLIARL